MADVTFRDFAAAHMRGDEVAAATVLEALLGLAPEAAARAAAHFRAAAATGGPAFMGQAMGLRDAVQRGDDAEIGALLTTCFGLLDAERAHAVVRVRAPR